MKRRIWDRGKMRERTFIMGKMKVRTLIMGKMKVRTFLMGKNEGTHFFFKWTPSTKAKTSTKSFILVIFMHCLVM